jgi:hypothetical protein
MNVISNAIGKVASFFSGIGTTVVKDYKGATKIASNDINAIEKDVKVVMWVVLFLAVIYIFEGRR